MREEQAPPAQSELVNEGWPWPWGLYRVCEIALCPKVRERRRTAPQPRRCAVVVSAAIRAALLMNHEYVNHGSGT